MWLVRVILLTDFDQQRLFNRYSMDTKQVRYVAFLRPLTSTWIPWSQSVWKVNLKNGKVQYLPQNSGSLPLLVTSVNKKLPFKNSSLQVNHIHLYSFNWSALKTLWILIQRSSTWSISPGIPCYLKVPVPEYSLDLVVFPLLPQAENNGEDASGLRPETRAAERTIWLWFSHHFLMLSFFRLHSKKLFFRSVKTIRICAEIFVSSCYIDWQIFLSSHIR